MVQMGKDLTIMLYAQSYQILDVIYEEFNLLKQNLINKWKENKFEKILYTFLCYSPKFYSVQEDWEYWVYNCGRESDWERLTTPNFVETKEVWHTFHDKISARISETA